MTENTDRPELRVYGYAPGSYSSLCYVGNHVADNIDKRATCCLDCAERLYKVNKMSADNPTIVPGPLETAPGLEDQDPCHAVANAVSPNPNSLEQYQGGKLTAMKNTAIALIVEYVDSDGQVHTMRYVGSDLRREKYDAKLLIGAGDELVFKDGVFDRAQ